MVSATKESLLQLGFKSNNLFTEIYWGNFQEQSEKKLNLEHVQNFSLVSILTGT